MNALETISNKNRVIIPIVLFIFSFLLLSFNLSGQGPHQDEIDFLYAYSIEYFELVKNGDFFHPCWNGNGECEELSIESCDRIEHWITTHGFVKHLLVGTSVLLHGENEPESYSPKPPLCKPTNNPIPGENMPTQDELSSARFFSPVLGSLTVVLAFFIGKILFNRTIGIVFGSLLLFNGLWFAYSRTVMSEPYIYFFIMLSFFLLLYSFRKKQKIKYVLLILSAITFAIAFNTKAITIIVLPLFISTIFLRDFINQKLIFSNLKKKRFFSSSIAITIFFFTIILISIFATLPFYWPGPIQQLDLQKESLEDHNKIFGIKLPWNKDSKAYVGFLSTITVTFVPIIDTYYENFSSSEIPISANFANNFSSVPLSILFITGLGYLVYSIRKKQITGSELLILFWSFSAFILLSLMVESYSTSRFFVMMFLPILLVSAYGYYRFFTSIKNKKLLISSFILVISTHAITLLIFWETLFFKPDIIWLDPLMIKTQDAITHVEVLSLSLIFLIFFIIYGIKKIK